MISHDRALELISARMDAPLTPAEHHELQGHLADCTACRVFVSRTDDIARDLQTMPTLPPSPMVSRGVMAAISTENSGWGWLRMALQALSSPGMAVASSMALVLALGGALLVALNAPGGNNPGQGVSPEGTIAAVAEVALPTEVPTRAPVIVAETPDEETPAEPERLTAEPTVTREPRTIAPAPTEPPKTPTPRPTATREPIVQSASAPEPVVESPPIVQAEEPIYEESVAEQPELAMVSEQAPIDTGQADLAQIAEPAVDTTGVQETIDQAPVEEAPVEQIPVEEAPIEAAAEPEAAPQDESTGEGRQGNRRDDGNNAPSDEVATEPEPTRPIGPLPAEAIAALEGAGTAPDFTLPPAPLDPAMPDQSFLPVTPTPETDGTPTPENTQASESEAPQLAEEWSGGLDVAELPLEEPVLAEAPNVSEKDSKKIKNKEKKDKSSQAGKSHEQQQAAFQGPLGWSGQPIAFDQIAAYQQSTDPALEPQQTGEYPVDASSTSGTTAGVTDPAQTGATTGETAPPERQIDPATGYEIDPATGFLIDPITGYLLDRVNGRVVDPRTGYEVHPGTGLLIDPATGAMLDPNTYAVVIPAGFGNDQPAYDPSDPAMRGNIESVVDETYDNASIKMIPATDGPVQPVGEIVIPTETGDALEIS